MSIMVLNGMASAIEVVFRELDEHLTQTTLKTGMKCAHLCNACCRTKNIEASPVEFIPLAAALYETRRIDEFLTLLDKSDETGHCPLFLPDAWKEGKGGCWDYEKRGLVCRLFGFGYRLDREGIAELVTCKVLKDNTPEEVDKARQLGYKSPDTIPLFRNYSMQLYSIAPDLAIQQLPVNQAIRIAIEKLYFHFPEGINQSDTPKERPL